MLGVSIKIVFMFFWHVDISFAKVMNYHGLYMSFSFCMIHAEQLVFKHLNLKWIHFPFFVDISFEKVMNYCNLIY